MLLSEKLRTTIASYETAIRAHPLTPAEQQRLHEMRTAFLRDPLAFASGVPSFEATVRPDPKNADSREHSLSEAELRDLARNGVLPPRPLPVEVEEMCQTFVDELGGIYDQAGSDGLMQQLQFFHPWASRPILDWVETFADIACQAMGCQRDQLLFDAQVFSSRLPAPLHCDFASHTFFDLNHLPQLLQFHINLRLPDKTAGLCFFPGTHKRIIFPRAALRLLVESGIDFDAELALKSLVLGERRSMQDLNNLCIEDARILSVPDGKGGAVPVHDFLVGLYCTFLYLEALHGGPKRDVEGQIFEDSLRKFVVFNPSILHCTDEDQDVGQLSRVSVAVRLMALPDARALKAGPVLVNPAVRWAYRNFVGVGLDKLGNSCVTFEDLYSRLPHRRVLSREEVGRALFGDQKHSKGSLVFLSPALADDVRLPYISFKRLTELNALAAARLKTAPPGGDVAEPAETDLGQGDETEQSEAVRLGLEGTIFEKSKYVLRQLRLAMTADEDQKPYIGVRLALLLDAPQAATKVTLLENDAQGRALLEHHPRITQEVIDELLALPADTLGGAYGRFSKARGLNPEFFPEVAQLGPEAAYAQARAASTHDLWHVVGGFDTTMEGEFAIASFVAGQLPTSFSLTLALGAALATTARNPRLLPALFRAYRRGQNAQPLLPVYWERMWELPLDEVRKRLDVTAEDNPAVAYSS